MKKGGYMPDVTKDAMGKSPSRLIDERIKELNG